jgi:four helix bundle protein
MQRAAISIPSNIAEGYERTPKDFVRMLRIALGSTAELRTQAHIARKIDLLTNEQMNHIISETKVIAKMMSGLIKSRQA